MKIKYLILFFIFSLPAVAALAVPGYFGASDDMHIIWLQQMDRAIKLGHFPPRYVPDLSYGFGYPLFNFVFPLPFYLAEVFHLLGFSLVAAVKLVLGLSLVLSGLSMFLLAKTRLSSRLSLLPALIYLYAPYRATDVYVRGAIGESVSFISYPLIILGILQMSQTHRIYRWLAFTSLAMAGLVLSHNISAYMFLPLAGIYAFWLLRHRLPHLLLSVLVAAALSAYFWLPAIIESNLMQPDYVFNYPDHFPTLRQLFTPYWGYGASVPGPYDGMSFFIGIPGLVFGLWGIINLFLKRSWSSLVIFALLILLLSIFMMNFRSQPIWDFLPFIKYFQFPWRFLTLVVFSLPLLVFTLPSLKKLPLILLLLLPLLFHASWFHPQDYLGRTDDYYLQRYLPGSPAYDQTQEEYLRLPKNTILQPSAILPEITTRLSSRTLTSSPYRTEILISASQAGIVNYRRYWFPGWTGTIDRQPLSLFAGQPYGQVAFDVPAGEHQVALSYREPVVRVGLNWLAVISLLGCSLLLL